MCVAPDPATVCSSACTPRKTCRTFPPGATAVCINGAMLIIDDSLVTVANEGQNILKSEKFEMHINMMVCPELATEHFIWPSLYCTLQRSERHRARPPCYGYGGRVGRCTAPGGRAQVAPGRHHGLRHFCALLLYRTRVVGCARLHHVSHTGAYYYKTILRKYVRWGAGAP